MLFTPKIKRALKKYSKTVGKTNQFVPLKSLKNGAQKIFSQKLKYY